MGSLDLQINGPHNTHQDTSTLILPLAALAAECLLSLGPAHRLQPHGPFPGSVSRCGLGHCAAEEKSLYRARCSVSSSPPPWNCGLLTKHCIVSQQTQATIPPCLPYHEGLVCHKSLEALRMLSSHNTGKDPEALHPA